jgi:hypothetical protein
MAGRDPATYAAPHHRPMSVCTVPPLRCQLLTSRVGGRIKSGHDDIVLRPA